MPVFKIIKEIPFDNGKVKGTNYILGVQGRAVNFSSLAFEDSNVQFAKNTAGTHLEVSGELEVMKSPYTNALGETVQGLKFMPKFGFNLSEI
jgi:hypothetical protein